MDPNEAYQLVKAALGRMHNALSDGEYADAATDLLISLEDLDHWLVKGGFLPDAWQAAPMASPEDLILDWKHDGFKATGVQNTLLREFGNDATWRSVHESCVHNMQFTRVPTDNAEILIPLLECRTFGQTSLRLVTEQMARRGLVRP